MRIKDLVQHAIDCSCSLFWCDKGIAKCIKCKRKFNEKTGKEVKIKELCELLQVTELSHIIKTISFIKKRMECIEILKKIPFDDTIKANEVEHLQKIIEHNTWIFGEQYATLAYAEDNFNTALKNYRKEVYDEDEYNKITDKFKNGQVDIFLCKQNKIHDRIDNLIIELKHPKKPLGEKHVSQIKKYHRLISKQPQFNGEYSEWIYLLIGSKFDNTEAIENDIKNNSTLKTGRIYKVGNHEIYVKKWSDIIHETEMRMKFLDEKLNIKKENLLKGLKDAMQFTGLTDVKGKKIFEGDIVKVLEDIIDSDLNKKYVVKYSQGGFGLEELDASLMFSLLYLSIKGNGLFSVEVIGNIYENPELLERK
jgi:hypothetical protein